MRHMLSLEKVRRGSLSARRAWIEIGHHDRRNRNQYVALRKESVDRNGGNIGYIFIGESRSPQGERG